MSPRPRWLLREKFDSVWQQWSKCQERHQWRCKERVKKQEQEEKQQHKNKKLSKFHSGTNVTAQSGATEAPDDGPMTLPPWKDPRWLLCQYRTGQRVSAVPFIHSVRCWTRAGGAHVLVFVYCKSPSRQEILRCHMYDCFGPTSFLMLPGASNICFIKMIRLKWC